MPKNFIQWCIVAFLSAIAIGFISSAIQTTQSRTPELDRGLKEADSASRALDKALKDANQPEISNISPKKLIIGKWRYMGDLEDKQPTDIDGVIEYFEDNTYSQRSLGTYLDETQNGEYFVLSDGRVKRTYERCQPLPCEKIVNTIGVNFPDQNKMQETNIYSPRTSVYQRIDTELEKEKNRLSN